MVKQTTRLNIIMAHAMAHDLGFHDTSERLQRLPDKIARFKSITDPERRLIQARWLSLDAESAETTFKKDLEEKKEMIKEICVSCESASTAIKKRGIGLALIDLSFGAITAYLVATKDPMAGTAVGLLLAAALYTTTQIVSALRLWCNTKLLKEGPKMIAEGITELKEEVCAIIGEN